MEIPGRRRPDVCESDLPLCLEIGDYWKVLDEGGSPKIVDAAGKLTTDCWRVVVPLGEHGRYGIANLDHHTVREEDDGTISVRPDDGSSNSILVRKSADGPSWHGYVERGVLRDA